MPLTEKEIFTRVKKLTKGPLSPASIEYGHNFTPRSDDIFIATAPKCGTTWSLNIAHMLRSNGDTDFKDILYETPWDCLAYNAGQNLDADHKYSPRVFKSHETYEDIAKGGKYIFVTRDPYDAFISAYYFMVGGAHVSYDECPMELFAKLVFDPQENFGHVALLLNSYLRAVKESPENVLFLFFEDMKSNPRDSIEKIGKFMGLESLGEEEFKNRCDVAQELSTLQYMKENKEQFSIIHIFGEVRKRFPELLDDVAKEGMPMMRSGTSGGGKDIPESVRKMIQDMWKDTVEKEFGFTSYEDFRNRFDPSTI
eukprot:snap_masked-scaffold_13-processed-gene-7.8-mRNA-1 protein AED:1.00 eAED:1.00 QI:0/-1/0/0/-1/1/1/0/310